MDRSGRLQNPGEVDTTPRRGRRFALLGLAACVTVALIPTLAPASAVTGINTIGIEPLSDRTELYEGIGEPGLFPGGLNEPSGDHLAYGIARTAEIEPRNAAGDPDPNGLIGFAVIGMSNATQEFTVFHRRSDRTKRHWGRVVLVNSSTSAQTIEHYRDPDSQAWAQVDEKIEVMGLTNEQVQVAWVKQVRADNNVQGDLPFPQEADLLRSDLRATVDLMRDRYPNLKVVYFSSRVFAGFGTLSNNPGEPWAFETAYAVKGVIEDQINGVDGLDTGPWLSWGPYLWADGKNARDDGLAWLFRDFEIDGKHTSESGEQKVATLLADFFETDPLASTWFLPQGDVVMQTRPPTDDAWINPDFPGINNGSSTSLQMKPGGGAYIKFDITSLGFGTILNAKLSVRSVVLMDDIDIRVGASNAWDQDTLTFANAPGTVEPALFLGLGAGREGSVDVDVTQAILDSLAAGDTEITFVYSNDTPAAFGAPIMSSESGHNTPQLTIVRSFP